MEKEKGKLNLKIREGNERKRKRENEKKWIRNKLTFSKFRFSVLYYTHVRNVHTYIHTCIQEWISEMIMVAISSKPCSVIFYAFKLTKYVMRCFRLSFLHSICLWVSDYASSPSSSCALETSIVTSWYY